ncbi:MAG: PASTA domain-containing protein, partial [Actinobacteria bacterium]
STDVRSFSLAQVDAFGNVSARTYALRGVPALAGKTQDDAAATLAGRGFTVGAVTTVASSAPAGTVVSPWEVAVAPEGSAVDLVVSAGPSSGTGSGGSGGGAGGGGGGGGNPQSPLVMRVAEAKRFSWKLGRTLGARVQVSRAATAVATLVQPSGVALQSWSFALRPGASVVKIQMPPGARRAGRYTVKWTAGLAPNTVTRALALRVLSGSPPATRGTAKRPVDVLFAGKKAFAAEVSRSLPLSSVRIAPTDLEGAFDLSASSSRDVRVVVVDTRIYGLQLVRDLRTVFPELRILAITTDRRLEARALKAGANAALPPTATAFQVARATSALLAR